MRNRYVTPRNSLMAVGCLLLVLSGGCSNLFGPPGAEKTAANIGYFSLIAGDPGRTIVPAAFEESDFAAYRLEFFTAGTTVDPVESADRTYANLSDPIGLNVGTWDLLVTAFADAEQTQALARGGLRVVIAVGEITTGSVVLGPLMNEGQGTFSWDISYPENVTRAGMTITPIDPENRTPAQTLYFTGGTPLVTEDTLTLNTGSYRVVFNLRAADGKQALHRETLHVYANSNSFFEYEFLASHFTDIIAVTSNADSGAGSLRQAIADAPTDGVIVIDNSVGTIGLNTGLGISKNLIIEGNGITIIRANTVNISSQFVYISSGCMVEISRIHFRNGLEDSVGGAIGNYGNLTLESCIFSGNRTSGSYSYSGGAYGGAVYNNGTIDIKGCTFYNNSSISDAGTIYSNGGKLTLTGNLFYGNTAPNYPIVYSYGSVVSGGYNVVDVALGTGSTQSGWTAAAGDCCIDELPMSFVSYKLLSGSGAAEIINTLPAGYPSVDFYGNPIKAPASAGAVQAVAKESGFVLELSVNDNSRGSVSVTPQPGADGFVVGNVTFAAALYGTYETYWLVNGEKAGSGNTLSLCVDVHTTVHAVFGTVFEVDNFDDTNGSAGAPGSLRHALTNAREGDTIRFTGVVPGTSVISLTGELPPISKSVTIEGNGITITRDPSWTSIGPTSHLLFIRSGMVAISRVHFKDGKTLYFGGAICNYGSASIESCIFSGNLSTTNPGGAVCNFATMSVTACTFYGNSCWGNYGGAIYNDRGKLTLTGNLFYGNTSSSYPVVYNDYQGVTSSLGYNAVDAELGTGNTQSGWSKHTTDKTVYGLPMSPVSFKLISGSGAAGIIDTLPAGYPAVDYYGGAIIVPAAAGAVQALVSDSGFVLDLSVNNSNRGSVSVTPLPNADGFVSGSVTITAAPAGSYETYWLVNGEKAGSGNTLDLYIDGHTSVQAIFSAVFIVNNFSDAVGGAGITGTLRNAINNAQNDDIIRFTGVTPGISVVELTNSFWISGKNITIEGNGITITRASSWTSIGSYSQLLCFEAVTTTISRVHFRNGIALYSGAIYQTGGGKLTLESCIFSGNAGTQSARGGAIGGTSVTVKACTFYMNSAAGSGGAIRASTLTLEGNLFCWNTAEQGYPVVYPYNGVTTSLGYNVVDVELGTGSTRSGWNAHTTDKTIGNPPISPVSFKLLPDSGAAGVITALPLGYPTVDFYGNPITAPAAAGAVQTSVSGDGYTIDLSVNVSNKGNITTSLPPDADGLYPAGAITLTAAPAEGSTFRYWLVNGEQKTGNPLNYDLVDHTRIKAVFMTVFEVDNFADANGSENTPGTLRYAVTNARNGDIVRFTGVTPGTSVVELTRNMPRIYSNITIEGNGITITRKDTWAANDYYSQFLLFESATATISRVHFKNSMARYSGAIFGGTVTFESCIFSENKCVNAADTNSAGVISHGSNMTIKGCTFYMNSSDYQNGVIYGGSTLEGNLFYANTAANGYPIARSGTSSLGGNVVDVPYGTGSTQAGWNAHASDKTLEQLLGSNTASPFEDAVTFTPVSGLGAVITSPSPDFPTVDFYGNTRTFPCAPGAVVGE